MYTMEWFCSFLFKKISIVLCVLHFFTLFHHHNRKYGYTVHASYMLQLIKPTSDIILFALTNIHLLVFLQWPVFAYWNTRFLVICNADSSLVVRVPGYRSRGPEFDSQHYQIF
jgi:hypothetical protein